MIRRVPLAVVAVLVAVAGMILLLWLLGGLVPPVTAALSPSPAQRPLANGGVTRYVAITGTDSGPNDCTSSGNPCRTIQHAVNSADDGDDILVTEGVYSDTFAVEGHWQVVFIRDKTVTIRGGYSTDFSTWAPDTYVTTLDGQGAGTGVWMQAQVATGGMTPTLEAVRVTNGAINPGAGGGIYAAGSPNHPIHPVISGCHVYSNSASMAGGGIYLAQVTGAELTGNEVYENRAFGTHPWDHGGGGIAAREAGNIRLTGNRVYSNTAQQNGGGVYVNQSDDVILAGNEIFSNTTPMSSGHTGGGVTLRRSYSATLAGNLIYSNTAFFGGGVNLSDGSTATLTGNRIYGNQARQGGGIHSASSGGSTLAGNEILGNTATGGSGGIYIVFDSGTMLIGNRIQDNTATFDGGGLSINQSERVTLTNNWVTENRVGSGYHGAGINVEGSSVSLLHNTIARNTGGDGSGVYARHFTWSPTQTLYSPVTFVNTILVSQSIGIVVTSGSTATLSATLWGDGAWENGMDVSGAGAVVSSTNVYGEPGFVDPGGLDYHITGASPARDAGVDAGVSDDIDGAPRPFGTGPDLGADELQCHARIGSTYYATVQDAVDHAAQDDLIQVAGTCQGVQRRAGSDQVAYVTETVTIRGGYSGDFSTWDPGLYPTTLDAVGAGRVVYVNGNHSPILEGLRLTNGSLNDVGGGVYAVNAHPTISGCQIYSNTATVGGGVFLQGSSDVVLVNDIVADNHVTMGGAGGVHLNSGSTARLLHTTLARNTGGAGIMAGGGCGAVMTNTILVSHTVGVQTGGAGATAVLTGTLWGDGAWANGQDTMEGPDTAIYTGTLNWWGFPAFADHENGDYHLGAGSAAFDRGVSTGVAADIDGDPRTVGPAPDLGADEGLPALAVSKSGPAWLNAGGYVTYTLTVTNTGVVTAHTVGLIDALPGGASFVAASHAGNTLGDTVRWPSFDVAPDGGVVTRTFTVSATDTITNHDYSATPQNLASVVGTVVVTSSLNHAPTANAGVPQAVAPNAVVTLDGSASSDPDGHGLAFGWTQTGGDSVTLFDPTTASPTFTAPITPGQVLTFTLTVTDTYGLVDSAATAVTVKHYVYLPLVLRND